MIRNVALLLALTLAHPALAQISPTPTHSPAKPASRKPAPPKPDSSAAAAAQQGPCIGVIPHIGDRFAVQEIELTVFGNDLKEVSIAPWGLDNLVVARVRAAVGTRIAVRRITYASHAFNSFDNPPSRLFRNDKAELKALVQSITRAGECERYVAVVKGSVPFGNTNQSLEGIGVVHSGIGMLSRTYLFAVSAIRVLDGQTYDILKTGGGGQEQTLKSFLMGIQAPTRELEGFSWPPTTDAVMGLRDTTRALLAESLDTALPDLLAQ